MRATEKILAVTCAAVVLVASCVIAGIGAPFQEAPPTTGVYRSTAYTLRGGEWQIGLGFVLTPLAVSVAPLVMSVEYGITDHLQIGVAPIQAVLGQLNLHSKLRIHLGSRLDMGIPFSLWLYSDPIGFTWGTGAVLSLRLGGGIAFHGGLNMGVVRELFYVSPYTIADFDVLPNLKLVGELGLIPVSMAVGMWVRPLPFLDVKLGLAPIPLSIIAGLYLQF